MYIEKQEIEMEYGVFSEPSFSWPLIKTSIACAILLVSLLLIFLSFNSITKAVSRGYRKRYETKTALLGAAATKGLMVRILEQANNSPAVAVTEIILIVCSFSAIWPLLGIGLLKGGISHDCYDQKYASQGAYEVVNAKLVYTYNSSKITVAKDDPRVISGEYTYHGNPASGTSYVTDKTGHYIQIFTPKKPDHYTLRLEGKTDPSLPVTINRCVIVPYDQISQNQKFTPLVQQTQGVNAPSISVSTPSIIEKYGDKWWKFKE